MPAVRLSRSPSGLLKAIALTTVAGAAGVVHRAGAGRPHNGVVIRAARAATTADARSGSSPLVGLAGCVPLGASACLAAGQSTDPGAKSTVRSSVRTPIALGVVGTALLRALTAVDTVVRPYDADVAGDTLKATSPLVLLAT